MKRIVETPLKSYAHATGFQSVTDTFLSSELSTHIKCPKCDQRIDFRKGVEWHGPDHFSCSNCSRLIGKEVIMRALRDLGARE